jgi:hypothetical protein
MLCQQSGAHRPTHSQRNRSIVQFKGQRNAKANARLIAAAPELLEALVNLWAICNANAYEISMG